MAAKKKAQVDLLEKSSNGVEVSAETPKARKARRSKNAPLKLGQIAHHHNRETKDYEIVSEPCPAVQYRVRHRNGLRINERLYRGLVVVPRCTANYLTSMDQEARKNEEAIHTNQGRKVELGEVVQR